MQEKKDTEASAKYYQVISTDSLALVCLFDNLAHQQIKLTIFTKWHMATDQMLRPRS